MYNIIKLPDNYRRYYNHLLDLMTTTINSAHLSPWAKRYAGLLGAGLERCGQLSPTTRQFHPLLDAPDYRLRDYEQWRQGIRHPRQPGLPSRQRSAYGQGYSHQRRLLPDHVDESHCLGCAVPLLNYSNFLAVQAFDNYGAPLTNASASIVVTNLGATALLPVVFNEWMAKNTGPGGFADPVDGKFSDWFELYNPNASAADISGWYLTDDLSNPTKSSGSERHCNPTARVSSGLGGQ